MVDLKTAKEICKLQGIALNIEVPVICPACNSKRLRLDVRGDRASCARCSKEYKSMEEVLTLAQEEYLDDNIASHMQMRNNEGVGYGG